MPKHFPEPLDGSAGFSAAAVAARNVLPDIDGKESGAQISPVMLTFHNDPAVKAHFSELVEQTGDPDDGVTIRFNFSADDYAEQFGLPAWLTSAENLLARGILSEHREAWPATFIDAVPIGADCAVLEREVLSPLLVSILRHALTTFDTARWAGVKTSIESVITLWARSDLRSVDWLQAYAVTGAATWDAVSECPITKKGNPMPGQEAIAAAFEASMMAAGTAAAYETDADPSELAIEEAIGHTDFAQYAGLATELVRLLRLAGPLERGDDMLANVRTA